VSIKILFQIQILLIFFKKMIKDDPNNWKRVRIFICLFIMFFCSGVLQGKIILQISGSVPLKLVFLNSNVYYSLCKNSTTVLTNITTCDEQELKINQIGFYSNAALYLTTYPIGLILDFFGKRFLLFLSSIFFCTGSLLTAFSTDEFDFFIPGNVLITITTVKFNLISFRG
jgi:hypothetical protein